MTISTIVLIVATVACLCFLSANADYDKKGPVEILTEKTFQSVLMKSSEAWLVEFYAPWCGHCKSLEPEYKKAAKEAGTLLHFAAVNCDVEKGLCSQMGIKGFPTIKFFDGDKKKKPEDYQQAREAKALIDFAKQRGKGVKTTMTSQPTKYAALYSFFNSENDKAPAPRVLYIHSSDDNKFLTVLDKVAEKFSKVNIAYILMKDGAENAAIRFALSKSALPALVVALNGKYVQTLEVKVAATLEKFIRDANTKLSNKEINLEEETDVKELPSFPPPDVPRRQGPVSMFDISTENFAKECLGNTKKNICVIMMIHNDGDREMVKKLAGIYRNDPFTFGVIKVGTLDGSDDDKTRHVISEMRHAFGEHSAMIAIKLGKKQRFAILTSDSGIISVDDELKARQFLDRVLGGDQVFTPVKQLPKFENDAANEKMEDEGKPRASEEDTSDDKDEV